MKMKLVKFFCDVCGKGVGSVDEDDQGEIFYHAPMARGTYSTHPDILFCRDHGWPQDLSSPKVAAKALRAKESGKTATHRSRCGPERPRPLLA
jgi:hypothetical protein